MRSSVLTITAVSVTRRVSTITIEIRIGIVSFTANTVGAIGGELALELSSFLDCLCSLSGEGFDEQDTWNE